MRSFPKCLAFRSEKYYLHLMSVKIATVLREIKIKNQQLHKFCTNLVTGQGRGLVPLKKKNPVFFFTQNSDSFFSGFGRSDSYSQNSNILKPRQRTRQNSSSTTNRKQHLSVKSSGGGEASKEKEGVLSFDSWLHKNVPLSSSTTTACFVCITYFIMQHFQTMQQHRVIPCASGRVKRTGWKVKKKKQSTQSEGFSWDRFSRRKPCLQSFIYCQDGLPVRMLIIINNRDFKVWIRQTGLSQ